MIAPCINAFALSGRVNIICCGITQGVASLALGYVLLPFQGASSAAAQQFKQAWLHSPCTMIQPALVKSENWVK